MNDSNEVEVNDSTSFINILNGKYGFRLTDIRRMNRNVMWPGSPSEEFVATLGYAVIRDRQPEGTGTYNPGPPVEEDGLYFQGWVEYIPTEEELAQKLRAAKKEACVLLSSLVEETMKRGVVFNFGDGDEPNKMHIQIRDADRVNILGMVVKSQRDHSLVQYFRTYENRLTRMDYDQVVAMSDASYVGFTTVKGTEWAVQDMIMKATKISEIPPAPLNLKEFYTNYAHLEWFDIV